MAKYFTGPQEAITGKKGVLKLFLMLYSKIQNLVIHFNYI